MWDTWIHLIQQPNFQWVMMACLLLGISSGVMGSFAYLRRYSLIGDVMAHATLPGIVIAFMLTGSKSLGWLLLGAAVAAWLSSTCITIITKYSRIKQDAALGIVLTSFYGLGIVLLTRVAHSGSGNQSGLDAFLFGKAASLVKEDVMWMGSIALSVITLTFLFFKELKVISFDREFATGLGYPVALIEQMMMWLIVLTVVIGLQAVGVVLMSALLIIPAVAARYWTERLDVMVILAGLFGGLSGLLGTFLSALTPRMPTGPVIVLMAVGIFVISLLFAPQRGLLMEKLRKLRIKQAYVEERMERKEARMIES